MTNRDILIQFLSEATGEKKATVRLNVHLVMRAMENENAGSTAAFHKDFSEEEAKNILADMRQRQAQIVDWFTRRVQQLKSS